MGSGGGHGEGGHEILWGRGGSRQDSGWAAGEQDAGQGPGTCAGSKSCSWAPKLAPI